LTTTTNYEPAACARRPRDSSRQVTIVNEVFLPTVAEVDQARALVDALRESEKTDNTSALVLPDGRFVDPAVAAGAQRILDIADAYGTAGQPTKGAM
jgi:citrate lyase beta subunit